MLRTRLNAAAIAAVIGILGTASAASAQSHPDLHVNPRWKECSIQLDPSLTQAAWRQFTREAGLVAYFRPLADARPMGKGKFEISMHQWQTNINDHDSAWNDTFVHPDSAHWLFEGEGLKFPGLMVRAGLTDKTDVGVYFTKNPNANYGFAGGQVQRNIIGGANSSWSASTRLSFNTLFGPDDVDLTVVGWDLVASRTFDLTRWASVSPYAGFSSYFARGHEKSAVVNLKDEYQGDSQAMLGAALRVGSVRLGAEYGIAHVNSFSLKVGIGR
ncbi:MAG: hypothetical protein U0163_10675 [Gemmatimonadaceae bacterium]